MIHLFIRATFIIAMGFIAHVVLSLANISSPLAIVVAALMVGLTAISLFDKVYGR